MPGADFAIILNIIGNSSPNYSTTSAVKKSMNYVILIANYVKLDSSLKSTFAGNTKQ